MALGATRRDILTLIVAQGVKLSIAGIVIGVFTALATTHLLQSLIYGVTTRNPAAYFTVICVLLLVTIVACAVPALRAAAVSPGEALRHE